ncbi:molybdenum cofactor biosynthesis protein MoaE [Herpetosiphon giganteus]|uniref:molybdenum cofactor biosynthesis protein MoaE n=1 Tax=Herpetosiphon giganteus TaxID=2029754 RepID=UPI0019596183|nr:molybdopterin synthase catalytic subunit [Herpetosiphon giganteus]
MQAFLVTETVLQAEPLRALVADAGHGAIVLFEGVARNNFGGRATAFLEYEAYPEMAEQQLALLGQQAQAQFGIGKVAIHHRIGVLQIGETAVLIAIGSAHRGAAFAAVAWLMDQIKLVVPIWKCEHWADGSQEWVGQR